MNLQTITMYKWTNKLINNNIIKIKYNIHLIYLIIKICSKNNKCLILIKTYQYMIRIQILHNNYKHSYINNNSYKKNHYKIILIRLLNNNNILITLLCITSLSNQLLIKIKPL